MIPSIPSAKQVRAVSRLYDLGAPSRIRPLKGGMISHSFIVTTSKGVFIIRKLGYSLNKYWRLQKKLEFQTLSWLKDRSFPYAIPEFLKNTHGNYISRSKDGFYEVYPYLSGRELKQMTALRIREVAKAMALYHNAMKGFTPRDLDVKPFSFKWILDKYTKMASISPKDSVDKLMLTHIGFFRGLLESLVALNLNKGLVFAHGDFSTHNLLFKKDSVSALIDFENIRLASRAYDIAYFLQYRYGKRQFFLSEYRKHTSFSREEEQMIVPYILLSNCSSFWWIWEHMEKRRELRYRHLTRLVAQVHYFYDLWRGNSNG